MQSLQQVRATAVVIVRTLPHRSVYTVFIVQSCGVKLALSGVAVDLKGSFPGVYHPGAT